MTATIHVVDDDEAMRHSLAFLLKSLGHPVESHDSAEASCATGDPGWPAVWCWTCACRE